VLERVLRDGREEALAEVAATICAKIGWSAGSGDERAFLEAYYTQLRERLERGMRFGQRKADKFVPDARQATSSAWRFTATELSYYGEQQLDVLEQVLRADDPETLGDVAARIGGKIGRGGRGRCPSLPRSLLRPAARKAGRQRGFGCAVTSGFAPGTGRLRSRRWRVLLGPDPAAQEFRPHLATVLGAIPGRGLHLRFVHLHVRGIGLLPAGRFRGIGQRGKRVSR
jgi:hypothetical protein